MTANPLVFDKSKSREKPHQSLHGLVPTQCKDNTTKSICLFLKKKSIWLSYVRGIELVDGLKNFNPKYLNFQLSVCVFLESTFYGEMAG
jgi:hypothetical protein